MDAKWMYICAVLAVGTLPATAAQTETCKSQADEKTVVGAALKSFMNNCRREAKSTCDESADDKSLTGTAHARFVKKCVRDAVGR
jgi:hypothetical protein